MTRISRTPLTLFVLLALLVTVPLVAPAAVHAQEEETPYEPEVRPQPFPAEPEQPPAERRPDEVQPADPPPRDEADEPGDPMQPPAEQQPYGSEEEEGAEVGTETEVEPPVVDNSGEQPDETTDVLEGDADDAAWYRDPLWVLVGLVGLVVVVILLFSGRRR
jgi:hypothetical protein